VTIGVLRRASAGLLLALGVAGAAHAQGHGAPEHGARNAAAHEAGKDAHAAPAKAAKPEGEPKKGETAGTAEEPVKVVKAARAGGSMASLPGDVDQIRKRMAEALGGAAPARTRAAAPAMHAAARPSAPSPSHAAPVPATSVAAPVRLVWKPAVVWPSELRPAADATGRIVLVWRLPASEVAAGTR